MTDADIVRGALDNPTQHDRAPNARAALARLEARAEQAERERGTLRDRIGRALLAFDQSGDPYAMRDALVEQTAAVSPPQEGEA